MLGRAFTVAWVVVALLVGLPLAACGGGGPSKQDFLSEADPVCQQGNVLANAITTPSDVPSIKDFTTKLGDNAVKTADRLGKLDPPTGEDGKAAKDVVKAMRDAAEAAKRVGPEVDAGDFPGIEAEVEKAVAAFRAADTKARSFGSAECGKGEVEAMGKLAQTSGATVKKAYIAKADALCAVATRRLDAIDDPEDMADWKALIDTAVEVSVKLNADLKALPQPTMDKSKLDAAFAANDELIAKAKLAQAAAATGDEDKTFDALDELDEVQVEANAKADAYGFKDCGSDV